MNYFDLVLGFLLVSSFIYGMIKGLARQVFSLAALFLGVYCAFKFSNFAGHFISKWLNTNEIWTSGIAFFCTFISVLVGVTLVGRIAEKLISFATLGFFNHLLGGILGVIKITLVVCVLLSIAELINLRYAFLPKEQLEASFLYQPLKDVGNCIFPYLQW